MYLQLFMIVLEMYGFWSFG